MTQRRRARAQVERTPGREVLRGPRADVLIIDDPWTPTTPPVDRAAEPVRIGPVAAMRWGDGPDGFALSMEALLAEMARYGSAGRSDDYTDALALAWQSAPDAWVRRAAIERRAVERTGRVLVAWLIGRWRR